MRHFLTVTDLSRKELVGVLDLASEMKSYPHKHKFLIPKQLAMIFQKPSTRTRVSFEVGMSQLGGNALYLNWNDLQLGREETISDTARVLSRYCDLIMARVFNHKDLEQLARRSSIPVINGLSDLFHPCQALADLLTIKEKKGKLKGVNLVFVGDRNNISHSLLLAGAMVGMNITVICPSGYEPKDDVINTSLELVESSGSKIVTTNNVGGVKNADFIYTDTWFSMGQKRSKEKRKLFEPYQVNQSMVKKAKKDVIVMHCLPAHRGEEISDGVIDSEKSVVFDQAENRLHTQKALMFKLLKGGGS